MNFRPKFIISIIALIAAASLIIVYFASQRDDAPPVQNNPVNTTLEAKKAFTDDTTGLSFSYPNTFKLNKSTDSEGKEYIVINPFNKDPETMRVDESARLLRFTFLEGTTLETKIADFNDTDNQFENVRIESIVINGIEGKRVSCTTAIGLSGTNIILPWNTSLLQISFAPNDPSDTIDKEYEELIKSVKNTKR